MQQLNFRPYTFRIKNRENKYLIFDVIRKKFVHLQPEEWVRQHCLQYLILDKNYPASHISVEKQIQVNDLKKRYDIVIYRPDGEVSILVECKAPSVPVDQSVFDQAARYNRSANADFLMLTNGLEHYVGKYDYSTEKVQFLKELPSYSSSTSS